MIGPSSPTAPSRPATRPSSDSRRAASGRGAQPALTRIRPARPAGARAAGDVIGLAGHVGGAAPGADLGRDIVGPAGDEGAAEGQRRQSGAAVEQGIEVDRRHRRGGRIFGRAAPPSTAPAAAARCRARSSPPPPARRPGSGRPEGASFVRDPPFAGAMPVFEREQQPLGDAQQADGERRRSAAPRAGRGPTRAARR